jgi:hypothetical protein
MKKRNRRGQFIIRKPRHIIIHNTFQFAMDAQFHYTGEQPVICLHFGCGKTLGPKERVYGDRCVSHQNPTSYTSLIDPYIFQ